MSKISGIEDWDLTLTPEFQQSDDFRAAGDFSDFSFVFTALELEFMIKNSEAEYDLGKIYNNRENLLRLGELEMGCPYLNLPCKVSANQHALSVEDESGRTNGALKPVGGLVIATPIAMSFMETSPQKPRGIVPVIISLTQIHSLDGEVRTGELFTPMGTCRVEPHFPTLN